jgi:hypothetical protein
LVLCNVIMTWSCFAVAFMSSSLRMWICLDVEDMGLRSLWNNWLLRILVSRVTKQPTSSRKKILLWIVVIVELSYVTLC